MVDVGGVFVIFLHFSCNFLRFGLGYAEAFRFSIWRNFLFEGCSTLKVLNEGVATASFHTFHFTNCAYSFISLTLFVCVRLCLTSPVHMLCILGPMK